MKGSVGKEHQKQEMGQQIVMGVYLYLVQAGCFDCPNLSPSGTPLLLSNRHRQIHA